MREQSWNEKTLNPSFISLRQEEGDVVVAGESRRGVPEDHPVVTRTTDPGSTNCVLRPIPIPFHSFFEYHVLHSPVSERPETSLQVDPL